MIRWPELIQFKRTFTDPVPGQSENSLEAKGIETFHDPAKFVDGTTVGLCQEQCHKRRILPAIVTQIASNSGK